MPRAGRTRRAGLGALLWGSLLATACSGAEGSATAVAPDQLRPTSTTTSTVASTTTTTFPVPPPLVVDGDPLAGNLEAEPRNWVDLVIDDSRVPHRLLATNRAAMPMDVLVSLSEQVNVWAEPVLPTRTLVPALGTVVVARLGPINTARAWSYETDQRYELGDPAAVPSTDRYLRPLPPHVPGRVSQGPGGPLSHTDPVSFHAWDYDVPVGTPVLAARPGVVATIDQGFTVAGADATFADRGNSVQVLHDDGTWALYLHVDARSARVRIGDRVAERQVLALSGHNGQSTGPHLHFAVLANRDHQPVSLPVTITGP